MAVSYSANQYENAFVSTRLKSWEVPRTTGSRPGSTKAVTKPVSTANGHLLPEYRRENSARTNFVGTWDLPKRLPGNNIDNPTARDVEAYEQLCKEFKDTKLRLTGQKFNYRPQRTSSKQLVRSNTALAETSDQSPVQCNEQPADNPLTDRNNFPTDEPLSPASVQDSARSNRIPIPDLTRERDAYLAGL